MSGSQLSWVIIAGFVLIGASSYLPRSVKGWIGRAGAFGLGAIALAAVALWALPHVVGPQASPLERIAFVALALPATSRAQESGFFGSSQGFEVQPEVDLFYHLADGVRLLLQVQDTAIPSEGNNTLAVGGFVDWFVAPAFRELISPDKALTHALNLRLGVRYKATLDPGTVGTAQSVAIRFEATPRFFAPWSILLSNRNRFQVNWNLGGNDSATYIYRGRLQAQREFDVGDVGLTPFVNVEFVWQSPPAMWNQFRMEAGLQASVHWFGRGQTFEVNYSTVTYLQPRRSWRPVLGIIWYQYF